MIYTPVGPEEEVVLRTTLAESGWLAAVRVQSDRQAPRWLLRALELTVDGTTVFRRGAADALGLSMFEGAGYPLERRVVANVGSVVELRVKNPGRVSFALAVVPVVRGNGAVEDPVTQHFRRWT